MNKSNLAVIAGGTGAIGKAIADQFNQIGFSDIIKIGTKTSPAIDFNDENTILETAEYIKKKNKPISIFFDATGILHHNNSMPEKTFKTIEFEHFKLFNNFLFILIISMNKCHVGRMRDKLSLYTLIFNLIFHF